MEASARDRVVVLMVDDQAMFGEAVRRMLAEDNEEQMEKLRRKTPSGNSPIPLCGRGAVRACGSCPSAGKTKGQP